MNIAFRKAVDADAPELLAVIQTAFAQYRGRIDPPSSAEHKTIEVVRGELAVAAATVAEHDDRVVGCVFYRAVTSDHGPAMYVDRLAVLPEARGHGVADKLLTFVEDAARGRQLPALQLSVRIALTELHEFYQRRGFELVTTTTHTGYAQPTAMVFRKPL